jgi:4-amino-4-deoxy-L-arabinose transferase-like glycosyltransferase
MLGYAFVPWLVITLAPKKYDRYTLLVWPAFAVLAGLLAELAFARARWGKVPRQRRSVAVGAVTFAAAFSLLVAPNGIVYSNPLLGGSEVVQDVVGLGGSVRNVGLAIEDREGAQCSKRRILSNRARRIYFPCGVLKAPQQVDLLEPGDYVVISTIMRLRDPEGVRELEALGRRVERVTLRGIDVADIYQVTRER